MPATIMAVLTAVRYAVMLALYGGFTAVIYSVCVTKSARAHAAMEDREPSSMTGSASDVKKATK